MVDTRPVDAAELRPGPRSPLRVLLLVLLSVFLVEGAIMALLWVLPSGHQASLWLGFLDACVLTLVVAPGVWFWAVRPLGELFDTRGRLLQQQFELQEQERGRVARDLHDGIGQQLTALLVGLRTIEEANDLAVARGRAQELRELAASAHRDVRSLAGGLRPALLEDLGLAAALQRLVEDFGRLKAIPAEVRCGALEGPRIPAAVESALFRITQEALANVARHAQATRVEVILAEQDRELVLTVRDHGRGFEPSDSRAPAGLGLGNMKERTELLGGHFEVQARPGAGTTIVARIPREPR